MSAKISFLGKLDIGSGMVFESLIQRFNEPLKLLSQLIRESYYNRQTQTIYIVALLLKTKWLPANVVVGRSANVVLVLSSAELDTDRVGSCTIELVVSLSSSR